MAASFTHDIDLLAASLTRDFPGAAPSRDRAWTRAAPLRVIDCVLSLNRRYDAFVVPRLDKFERAHPGVRSVANLRALIGTFPSPTDFMRDALDYRDPARATTLAAVVEFVVTLVGDDDPGKEQAWLEAWARTAKPSGYLDLHIPGFGIAGFQYLRMLFGANTTKPDVHIRRYVGEAVEHTVSDIEAITLLDAAAIKASISLRDADTNIWEKRARADAL